MAWTEAEQAVADHLAAEPGPLLSGSPPGPGGWVASVRSGGGEDADLATVRFRKTRVFPACQLHFAVFATRGGSPRTAVLRTWQQPGGTWAVSPIGGGGGGPYRSWPWVNFTAQSGTDLFAGGGEVIGEGAEQAAIVRLTFADGTAIEDTVDNGVVLFATSPGPESRARVEILSGAGVVLAEYDEFDNFA
ncbi:MAG: hypothetical protein M3Y33_00645 [Actinomycetota bacterium]|nr:hypothetical protein [Actinomycetota bacterium]